MASRIIGLFPAALLLLCLMVSALDPLPLHLANVTAVIEAGQPTQLTNWSIPMRQRCADWVYGTAHPQHWQAPTLTGAAHDACLAMIKVIEAEERRIDSEYIRIIASFPPSTEKLRVISFGLYGDKPKYTHGALINIKLAKIYFPGWVCRFYICDVPQATVDEITAAGGEVSPVSGGKNMLARFAVATDNSVDRFLVRDIDSRLNARERFAVEQWVHSNSKLHTMRDHLNQQYEYNGGMWGGVRNSVPLLLTKIKAIPETKLTEGMIDIHTLGEVWQTYKNTTMAHDSHHCERYRSKEAHQQTYAFPTRRPLNYLHVGQVYNDDNKPRLTDVDRYMRGRLVPEPCRGRQDWITG